MSPFSGLVRSFGDAVSAVVWGGLALYLGFVVLAAIAGAIPGVRDYFRSARGRLTGRGVFLLAASAGLIASCGVLGGRTNGEMALGVVYLFGVAVVARGWKRFFAQVRAFGKGAAP